MIKFAVKGSGDYLRKGLAHLAEHGYEQSDEPELLVCLAHPEILTKAELDAYPLGCINFHCGLPKYRGRHPLQWMLIDGVSTILCAVHFMDEGIDTGPIICKCSIAVTRDETYASALEKVTDLVGPLVVDALHAIDSGFVAEPQDTSKFLPPAPRRSPKDSEIHSMEWDSQRLHRFINALSDPMPNAFHDGRVYKRSYSGTTPGHVVAECTDGRVVVATGDGVILVDIA